MITNTLIQNIKTLMSVFLISTSFITLPVAAQVTGPVTVGSLPGGGSVIDSDPGSGEQWGRVGGRSLDYIGIDPSLFSTLMWGATGTGAVGIAFDGEITVGTAERLSFSAPASDLAGGIAVWLGTTTVSLNTGVETVDTRFVLTVTQAGTPISLTNNPSTGLPGVDLVSTGSSFTANLRMEAKLASTPTFQPALDLFDALHTDAVATELAQTSFSHGFYFGSATAGLSLEEHDANTQAATEEILADLDFLTLESVGRLTGLSTDLDGIDTLLDNLYQEVQALSGDDGSGGPILDALQEFQMNLMQILWGVEFDDNGVANYDTVTPISSLARQKLDLQVIHPAQASSSTRRMLVLATESGQMTGGVNINVVAAISDNDFAPVIIEEFYVSEIAPGLLSLEIPMKGKQNAIKTFLIIAEHEEGNTSHQGSILTTDTQ